MDLTHPHLTLLLLIAVAVALAARRLRLPYTVGLVATGAGLALLHPTNGPVLTHDLIFETLLPPLLFEAALALHWRELRQDWLPILTLATLGVVISAATVTAGMVWGLGWPAAPAAVFGVLIAATDPVSVIALFKDLGVAGRLRCLVEAESLLNDGVAAVLFTLVLAWAMPGGAAPTTLQAAASIVTLAGGGIAIGAVTGFAAIQAAGRATDHLVETALTLVAAYGAFILAEHLHLSGVLATVTAGLVMGNLGLLAESGALSDRGREVVEAFWEFAAFLANSLVFLLIGLAAANLGFARLGWRAALGSVALVLLGRALSVYPLAAAFRFGPRRIPLADQHVLWWGGLRGALGLALALALPPALPMREEVLLATFCVVVFSVVVQGVTMRGVLGWAGR